MAGRKHPYLNLNMGLVKENYVVAGKTDVELWEARGFRKIEKYPLFRCQLSTSEIIMLGKPLTLEEFGADNIIGSVVMDISTTCGTYGMGGPGFFGIKLQGQYGVRWLIYCLWSAAEHVLLNDRVLACHPDCADACAPWIDFNQPADSLQKVKKILLGTKIVSVTYNDESITFIVQSLEGSRTVLCSYKTSQKFPEQIGAGKKNASFENGKMKDYWLVTYENTHLRV